VIEVVISITIFAGTVLGLLSVLDRLQGASNDAARLADMRVRARSALDRIVRELGDSGLSVISPQPVAPLGASSLTYQRAQGYESGNIVWGPQARIEWRLEPGEIDDGRDNDGDGLIDEGEIVWTERPDTPDAHSVVWCTGVAKLAEGESANLFDDNGDGLIDEPGLSFQIADNVLAVRLTLERYAGRDRESGAAIIERVSASTSVFVRNP
jgi:hypothetical protein